MALLSGLLRWHENAEKRRREKSGFVRFPGLLATACRPLATVGLLSSGSVLFSTPSLLEIYVAARHVPHRNDTNIPWKREPPNNLHADGLTDIDIEEDEDTRKASSFVVLSTGVVEQVSKEAAAAEKTVLVSREQLGKLQEEQREHLEKWFQELKKHSDEADNGPERQGDDPDAASASGEAAEGMQHTSGLSPGGIEEQMQKLQEAVHGMARLLHAGGNLHAVAGLDAVLRRLEAANGAASYDSTDGATSRIAIVPIKWEDNAPGANWEFPFLQVNSRKSSSSKVAVLKTVQFVQIPEGKLSALLPWRSYYRVAFDGMSKVGAPWHGDWPLQAKFLVDAKLFAAICQHEYDASVSLESDKTNERIKGVGLGGQDDRQFWWNAVIEDKTKLEELFGQADAFQTQIRDGDKSVSIESITPCNGDYKGREEPCRLVDRKIGETIVADMSSRLGLDKMINSETPKTPEPRGYKVECAAQQNVGSSSRAVFRKVFVEFWLRKLA
ncbi:unnamed protein product [Amoebophrya sp. A25]|nr:unnamed protein product [Amoebophrya sp. A25]|eukprot:GSA25T00019871001.1